MIIDLKGMETTVLPNFKGGEKEYKAKMYFDGTTRIMHGTLEPGASIGFHVAGKGKVLFDDGVEYVEAGQCHFCPKGHSHSLINEGPEDLVFYAAVPELG